MQGDLVKALKIVSRAKGWDPDRIWNAKTKSYEGSLENTDKAPEIFVNQAGTGTLPQGTPDSFPEAEQPKYEEGKVSFNHPDTGRETKNRATRGSDPYAGQGG